MVEFVRRHTFRLLLGALLLAGVACNKKSPAPVEPASTDEARAQGGAKQEEPPAPAREPLTVMATAPAVDLYRFFCGQIKNSMNHPAVWLDRAKQELVICGRGSLGSERRATLQRFPAADPKQALAAYHALLVRAGYQPAGAPPKKKPQKGYVVVAMDDLLPSNSHAKSVFNSEQYQAISAISASRAYGFLSGSDGGKSDRPTMYAYSSRLSVLAPGLNKTFAMSASVEAFAAFAAALQAK